MIASFSRCQSMSVWCEICVWVWVGAVGSRNVDVVIFVLAGSTVSRVNVCRKTESCSLPLCFFACSASFVVGYKAVRVVDGRRMVQLLPTATLGDAC